MEKVVYILGAGFSAPRGLPVISDFLFKSQDMYFKEPEKYSYFKHVFDEIAKMAVSKNYYKTNLFNIEEILSILEMGDYLEGQHLKEEFVNYIKAVIQYYTPPIPQYSGVMPGNWEVVLFGNDDMWRSYGYFVANLLNLNFWKQRSPIGIDSIAGSMRANPAALYGVITLNYDLVLENLCSFLYENFEIASPDYTFLPAAEEPGHTFVAARSVRLAKLHGGLNGPDIVPPTWSKGANTKIVPAWNLAQRLLMEATHIRIIGFSLPVADAYIKYLLKSASIFNQFVRHIDVICLDSDNSVRARFDEFIEFDYYRFVNANTTDYLSHLGSQSDNVSALNTGNYHFAALETAHESFMKQH